MLTTSYGKALRRRCEGKAFITPYEYVVYDSEIEREFAGKLDERDDIKLLVKLPAWLAIDTPVGKYNPDWAILKSVRIA